MSPPRRTIRAGIVGALFVACASVWGIVYAEAPRTGALRVAVLDVGQGDAIFIESPTGVQVLVDGGPGSEVLRALPEVMPRGDRTLDAVVATHPDADHIGGLREVLRRYSVAAYLSPGIPKDTATARALEEEVSAQELPQVVARRGMLLTLGGGAQLRVLYPDRDVSALAGERANEGGVVMRLIYKEAEMLLMADVGAGVEAYLVALEGADLRSDVLKVGHHGSKYSSSPAFVAAVSPEVAAISVGKNSYGHPTDQTLGVLEESGARVMRTDKNGTIRCVSDGAAFSCE